MDDTFDYVEVDKRQNLLDQRIQVILALKENQKQKEYLFSVLSELNKELYG